MKICNSCGSEAEFVVKGSKEFYCRDCAELELGSLNMVEPIKRKPILKRSGG